MLWVSAAAIMVIFYHGRSGEVRWRKRRRTLRRMFAAIVVWLIAYLLIAVFIARHVW